MADGVGLAFAPTFASHMVLQQAPSSALIYGAVNSTAHVHLRLESSSHGNPSGQRVPLATSITVRARVSQHGEWEVRLPPMPSDGSEHTITASAVLPESGAGQLHPARREVLLQLRHLRSWRRAAVIAATVANIGAWVGHDVSRCCSGLLSSIIRSKIA